MVTNTAQLNAALHQLNSFMNMLDTLRLDAEERQDFSLFPLISKGYFVRVRELNEEIRSYLDMVNESAEVVPTGKLGFWYQDQPKDSFVEAGEPAAPVAASK